jgi:phosphate transport system substrate-binding protein
MRVAALATMAVLAVGACSTAATASPASTAAPATAAPATAAPAPSAASPSAATAACPAPPSGSVTLQGAGATFPNPLYQVWFEKYTEKYPNILFNYQSIGSGGGVTQFTQRTVDFGASDAALKDDEAAKLPGPGLHIPTALGAVVVIFNLPGVDKVQLDSANVADIFLGTITKWNDAKIAANNAGVTLPDQAIQVVHRQDGSGTTNAFTTYLDTVSPDWHTKVGAGKEVKWPVGQGAQGNDGVANGVKQNPGAVGYVELQYATQAKLSSAYVKNADGKFVPGSTDGVTAAADAAVDKFPADFRQAPIINGAGPDTYPIASYTYLLGYVDQTNKDKGQALVAFMCWALTDGQALEKDLGFAPLPAAVDQKSLTELHKFTNGGAPIWP